MLSRHCYFLHDYLFPLRHLFGFSHYKLWVTTIYHPFFNSKESMSPPCHLLIHVLTSSPLSFFIYCVDLVCNEVLPPLVSQATRDQKVAVTVIGRYIKYSSQCHMIIIAPMISFPMTLLTNMFAITIMNDWNSDKISCVLHPNNYVLKSYHGLIESWMKNHLAN